MERMDETMRGPRCNSCYRFGGEPSLIMITEQPRPVLAKQREMKKETSVNEEPVHLPDPVCF